MFWGMFVKDHIWPNMATLMFSYHHLLRLMLASNGMDSGLLVLHYFLGGKFSHIYTMPSACSVGLSSHLWYTILFIYWWPAEWETSHMSRTLVGFSRKQRPGIQIRSSYSSCLLCYVGVAKSVLYPSTSVEYIGLTVDSLKHSLFLVGRQRP